MVTKVIIKDNTKSPIYYLEDLPAFKNGKEFIFKEGVNIIVGENGSGKFTKIQRVLLP
jgi:predicted ATPase